ncbi:MAG: hypothetical protein ICV87_08345 [Gemmatimonadetes bacterium]|nr:hypothetical protein [Gemmatimonadota bacterium]
METRHLTMMAGLAQMQLPAESDPEVVRALEALVAHHGDLALSLRAVAPNGKYRVESLLDRLDEALMGKGELKRSFEEHRRAMVAAVVGGRPAADRVTRAAALICSITRFTPPVAALAFLSSLPSGVQLDAGPGAPLTSHRATIARLAQAQLPVEPDPEVVRALKVVVAHRGNLALSLRDVARGLDRAVETGPCGVEEATRLSRGVEALRDRLDEVLMGRPELRARFGELCSAVGETVVSGRAAPGHVTRAAALIGSLTHFGPAVASIAFLHALRIGIGAVRAAEAPAPEVLDAV